MNNLKLHYDDISIVPEIITDINSRQECDPFIDGMLPIFASPMGSVIDDTNWRNFLDNRINVVIPRTIQLGVRLHILWRTCGTESQYKPFVAFSLAEAEKYILKDDQINDPEYIEDGDQLRVCIDLANGHMRKLLNLIQDIKKKWSFRNA